MLEGDNKLLLSLLPLEHTVLSQFMLALSLFVWLIAPLILQCTVRPPWLYLCHHIRLSGGKSLLMTQRLLALCFGLPVNAGHANGISPHKPSLSVYNNCCILLLSSRISKHNTTSLCCFTQWHCQAVVLKKTASWKGGLSSVFTVTVNIVVYCSLISQRLLSGFKTYLPGVLSGRKPTLLHYTRFHLQQSYKPTCVAALLLLPN